MRVVISGSTRNTYLERDLHLGEEGSPFSCAAIGNEQVVVVSVVMAVFNEVKKIAAAIDSIIDQSFTDWELIVIDDGSLDSTAEVIQRYIKEEPRIRLIENKKNLGLAASLNRGVAAAQGCFIARMDGDDVCYPERLQKQVEYLQLHPNIAVVGANARMVSTDGRQIGMTNMPVSPDEIKRLIIKLNPLIHPLVMFRKSFFEDIGGYDSDLRRKQDYDLWLRGVDSYLYSNLKDVLLDYTVKQTDSFTSDLYGVRVRVINAFRCGKPISGVFWAIGVFLINMARKLGYKQRAHREMVK